MLISVYFGSLDPENTTEKMATLYIAQSNIVQPSIFELISSTNLNETFYPAFKKIAEVIFMDLFINYVTQIKIFFYPLLAISQNYYTYHTCTKEFRMSKEFTIDKNKHFPMDFIEIFV